MNEPDGINTGAVVYTIVRLLLLVTRPLRDDSVRTIAGANCESGYRQGGATALGPD